MNFIESTITIADLEHRLDLDIGMLTSIVVGKSNTYRFLYWMVTPQGYKGIRLATDLTSPALHLY